MGFTAAWIALTVSVASAQATLDAAQLLSRFPAGAVPDAPVVHAALDALSARGDSEALTLLQSLKRHEQGPVQAHADDAEAIVAQRVLHDIRAADAGVVPDAQQIDRWVSSQRRSPGAAPVGELRVVAYVAVLTQRTVWHSASLGSLTPQESGSMVRRAERLELQGRFHEALPLLIDASMSGSPGATRALADRGVDMNRLSLGLSSEYASARGLPPLHQLPVVQATDPEAVTVLLARVEGGGALPQLAAIESLGVLLRQGRLDATLQKRAQVALNRARSDLRPNVRRTAESALSFSP
jgi:hypothetical protein